MCSKHNLLLTSAVRPGDNLHNDVQKIETLNCYENVHFLHFCTGVFILWHSSKGSLEKAMHSLLTLNLLAWGLSYFLLSWENIQRIRVNLSLVTMNLHSPRSWNHGEIVEQETESSSCSNCVWFWPLLLRPFFCFYKNSVLPQISACVSQVLCRWSNTTE